MPAAINVSLNQGGTEEFTKTGGKIRFGE